MQGITQAPRPPSRPWSSSCRQLLQHREATTDSELLDVEDNGIFIPPGPTISPSDKFKNEHGVPHELISEAVQNPTVRRVATNQNWWPGRPGETSSPQQHIYQVVDGTAVLWR